MESIILSGMIKEFTEKFNLQNDKPEVVFEKFSNYCLMKTDHYDSFEFDKVSTGECVGVDGIAVSIGSVIVDEIEDAKNLTRMQFDTRFIFTQAKTSSSFNLGDFLKFTSTIRTFFTESIVAIPEQLKKSYAVKEHIYNNSSSKMKLLPVLEVSYIYTGKFDSGNDILNKQIEAEIGTLKSIPYKFSKVVWHIYDSDSIARLYRETQNDILKDLPFQRHIALPAIKGAKAAYLGVVKCKDFIKIIEKEDGEINKGIFFENVRDFLGIDNPVNIEIARTINSISERDRFSILNNGVALVAKSVTPSGDIFKISHFQIVNGCQTSHVLYNNRNNLSEDMYITVKLIETTDLDLSGQIISTTNSQSLVTKEAFATIRPYHRILEDYFSALRTTGYEYYYERRPHQYDDFSEIHQSKIISAPSLIKSFISAILEEPHKVHYYYGTLLSEYNQNRTNEIFSDQDYPGLYFIANHLVYKTKIKVAHDPVLKEWIYHLALLEKRLLVPGLRKGSVIGDDKFIETLSYIDEHFNDAYKYSVEYLLSKKLGAYKNRSVDVTKSLLEGFNKDVLPIFQKNDGRHQKIKSFILADGRYIGTIDKVNISKRTAIVIYGPFRIECKANGIEELKLVPGNRVAIISNQSTIIYSEIK